MIPPDRALRSRLILASVLLLLAVILLVWYWNVSESSDRAPGDEKLKRIDAVVDAVLARHGIEPARVQKWQVRTPGGGFSRTERKVLVSRELVSVEFNRDLQDALGPLGAHVTGTERTKESVVILHIIADDRTVQTITLLTEKPEKGKGR